MKNNKKLFSLILSIILFIVGISFTYAAFSYSRQGTSNSKQLVGDIYMHYTESNTLTLENAMPSNTYIANKYFEFTIDGKNTTTNKDIYFDIILDHGDVPTGKTEANRIDDQFLKFKLVEVIDNTEGDDLLLSSSYTDIRNRRIFVETIPKNTTSGITHTYKLYMWIGDEVVIGNINQDYTESEWSNLFASIKVNVTGDFEEKSVVTDERCFKTELFIDNMSVNPNMNTDELNECINYFSGDTFDSGSSAASFCQGTGTSRGYTFQYYLEDDRSYSTSELEYFLNHNFITGNKKISIIGSDFNYTQYFYNNNMSSNQVQTCVNFLTSLWGQEVVGDTVLSGETYEAFCSGTGTIMGFDFQDYIDLGWFDSEILESLQTLNIVVEGSQYCNNDLIIPNKLSQVSYTFNTNISSKSVEKCVDFFNYYWGPEVVDETVLSGETYEAFCNGTGTNFNKTFQDMINEGYLGDDLGPLNFWLDNNIVIKNYGAKYPVVKIGEKAFTNLYACYSYWGEAGLPSRGTITSVEIPNSVETIGNDAFFNNQITSLIIPNNVKHLEKNAFAINNLSNVKISNGMETISERTFLYNKLTNIEIPNNIKTINYGAFEYNQLTNVSFGTGLSTIGTLAFDSNFLANIEIPNNVTTIGNYAFSNNQLASVTIGNGITSIGQKAFSKSSSLNTENEINYYDNPNLSSITISKSCNDIKNNLKYNNTNYYPWSWNGSSNGIVTTIYGVNNEFCESFGSVN